MAKLQNYSPPPHPLKLVLIGRASESDGNDDPDLLFLYGKALFQVAQKNSQVLGGAPASDPSFGPPLHPPTY